jgi:DNA polymerase III delta prime subunit
MYYNNDPMLAGVDDMNTLYTALCELDEIIGMYEVKDSIVKQIKFLLVSSNTGGKTKFDSHMLHTVVFGPPGVGKTTVGSCLANIWKGLGLIDKKKLTDNKIKSSKNIRILPIPIFLMKENKEIKDDEEDSNKTPSETKIKTSYNEQPDDEISQYSETVPKAEKKSSNFSKYKKKSEGKEEFDLNYKIKELKDELDALTNREKDSLDDKRRYVAELCEYRKKIREFKLLSLGIKNVMRTTELTNAKPLLKRAKFEAPIKIVSRPDFVGQYVGHTCDKTQKLLMSTLEEGKVLFIDEAYSIVLDEKDSFGHEALNELNRFMSEHPELVVIFAGYKDKIEKTLFTYQPGFKRRCTWLFEIANYTGEMLADIFKKQLARECWEYKGSTDELIKFFNDKIKNFDAFGGDTTRLAFYCKLKFSELKFDYRFKDSLTDRTITHDIVKSAYSDLYCKNKPEVNNDGNESWKRMFV